MRILAIADIHGNRSKLREILSAAGLADVIVLAGDLTHLGGPDDAQAAVKHCRPYAPHVLTVSGNCDDELIEKQMTADGNSLTGTGCGIDDVGFFGVSAAPHYLGNTWEVDEAVFERWLADGYQKIRDAKQRVLVSHPPPYGLVDWAFTKKHGGSQAVRAALDRYAIALVICGHIHEARGVAYYNDTTVVNCGPAWMGFYAVVEFGANVSVDLRQVPTKFM